MNVVELIFQIIILLAPGIIAGAATGSGAIEIFGIGIIDDLFMFLVRKLITTAAKFTFEETVAFSIAWDETIKGIKAGYYDQQDEDRDARIRYADGRYRSGSPLTIGPQLDIYDPLLLWWSADVLLSSDAIASIAGVLGEAAVIL